MIRLNNLPLETALKRTIQKTAGATDDLRGNKIAYKMENLSRTSQRNSSKIVTNQTENIELDREIPKERYISPEKKNWWSEVNIVTLSWNVKI